MKRVICLLTLCRFLFAVTHNWVGTAAASTEMIKVERGNITVLTLGEPYSFPLTVWNKEIERGTKDVKLDGFELKVYAYHMSDSLLTSETLKNRPNPGDPTSGMWFQVQRLALRYYNNWNDVKRTGDENISYLQANLHKLSCNDEPVDALHSNRAFAKVEIHSRIKMSRNDALAFGDFQFQPDKPGLYRIAFQISRHHEITDAPIWHVYFKCPDYTLTLGVENENLLHHISYTRLDIPLVTSTFFEENSADFDRNATDQIFHNTFIATVTKRMSCRKYFADLPILYDKTVAREKRDLGKARAEKLHALLRETTAIMTDGQACETEFKVREATPEEWSRYVKRFSEVSPEKFSQENRVVPMVLDLPTQRVVFAPLAVDPQEKSDEVILTAELQPQVFWINCIRAGEVVVANEKGDLIKEDLLLDDLLRILQSEKKILLNSPRMQRFLQQGRYTAQLRLTVGCPEREIWSNSASFFIERRLNVIRDEIFALNQYDQPVFTYEFDYERVDSLAHVVLQTTRDTLLYNPSLQPPDALVLISGHACVLGESISRLYNLGLSFGRALYLRNLLLESIRKQSSKYGMEVQTGAELCTAKRLVGKFVHNPEITKLLNGCFQATDGKALEGIYEGYLDRIIREKVRHFESQPATSVRWLQDVPHAAEIRRGIEEIKNLLPGNLLTVALKRGGKTVNVHFVAVGFGVAVPFYRHFTMPDKMREAFRTMGFGEADIPASFYGDDQYPAGRLMNRRVEVNLIW